MIQYSLVCDAHHRFDAWFKSSAAYAEQAERGILTCPVCRSAKVDKAIMAPSVARGGAPERVTLSAHHPDRAQMMARLRAIRQHMVERADYVGPRFAEEARKIHFGEADARGIYGEATREEARDLVEEGIAFLPLPALPEEQT